MRIVSETAAAETRVASSSIGKLIEENEPISEIHAKNFPNLRSCFETTRNPLCVPFHDSFFVDNLILNFLIGQESSILSFIRLRLYHWHFGIISAAGLFRMNSRIPSQWKLFPSRTEVKYDFRSCVGSWDTCQLSGLTSAVFVTGAFPRISCLDPTAPQLDEIHTIPTNMYFKSSGPFVCMTWQDPPTRCELSPSLVGYVAENIENFDRSNCYGRPPSMQLHAYDMATGKRLLQFSKRPFDLNVRPSALEVVCCVGNSDRRSILIAGDTYASRIYLYDAMSGDPVSLLGDDEHWWTTNYAIRIRADSRFSQHEVFVVGGPSLSCFDLVRGQWIGRTPVAEEDGGDPANWKWMRDVAFLDSLSFWTVSRDRTLRLWDRNSFESVRCQDLPGEGNGMYFAQELNLVVVGMDAGSVVAYDSRSLSQGVLFRSTVGSERVWNLDRVDENRFVAAGKPAVVSVFSSTGKILASREVSAVVNGMCAATTARDESVWKSERDTRLQFLCVVIARFSISVLDDVLQVLLPEWARHF